MSSGLSAAPPSIRGSHHGPNNHQTARVGESDAGRASAFLLLKYGMLFGCTVTQQVRLPAVKPASNNPASWDCTVHYATRGGATIERTRFWDALSRCSDTTLRRGVLFRSDAGGLIGTHAERRGVTARNPYRSRGAHARSRLNASRASKRSGVTRPCN